VAHLFAGYRVVRSALASVCGLAFCDRFFDRHGSESDRRLVAEATATMFGLLGVFLAVPAAALVQIVIDEFYLGPRKRDITAIDSEAAALVEGKIDANAVLITFSCHPSGVEESLTDEA